MALRLHRISDEEWQRLAAARRGHDTGAPPRTAIGAIEIELRALGSEPAAADADAYPRAAAG